VCRSKHLAGPGVNRVRASGVDTNQRGPLITEPMGGDTDRIGEYAATARLRSKSSSIAVMFFCPPLTGPNNCCCWCWIRVIRNCSTIRVQRSSRWVSMILAA